MPISAQIETASRPQLRLLGYWMATSVAAALFAMPGAALLAHAEHFAAEMARLGFPDYFLTILGVSKLAGAAVILAPGLSRLKEWAYAGLMFDALGAAAAHALIGDATLQIAFPLAIAGILTASWALRPASRRLPGY